MRKHFLLFILIYLVFLTGQARGAPGEEIRRPVVAGMFYPSDPHELRKVVQGYIGNVEKGRIDGRIVAMIYPHEGYMYSGQVDACAYKFV